MSLSRRQFLATSSIALAGASLSGRVLGAAGQAPAAPPVTAFTDLRRGVGVFTGNGGNIGYFVNSSGAAVVDSQFPQTAAIALDGMKTRSPKGIDLLLNTHHHGDHTGGNKVLRPAIGRIVGHERCLANHRRVAQEQKNEADQAFADVTFTDTWSVTIGDETIRGKYYGAGHTGGDAVYTFEKANVVHGGDLFFYRAHPNIDLVAGASAVNWITVLERVTRDHDADAIYIVGHGKAGTATAKRADILYFRDYLTAAVEHARAGLTAGRSKEEIQKIDALKGFEDVQPINARLTLPFVVGICVDELSAKK